jgi:hypothetical protein
VLLILVLMVSAASFWNSYVLSVWISAFSSIDLAQAFLVTSSPYRRTNSAMMETEKRDTAMIEDKDRESVVSLDKEAQATLHQVKPGMTAEDVEWLNSIPPREQARIYHKVDRRLVPMLALLYLIGECGTDLELE